MTAGEECRPIHRFGVKSVSGCRRSPLYLTFSFILVCLGLQGAAEVFSDTDHPIYQFGRKRKSSDHRTARSDHYKSPRRGRRAGSTSQSSGEESVQGQHSEHSDYSDTDDSGSAEHSSANASSAVEAPVLLQEDDICALCNQAWVTPAEVQAFLDLKLQAMVHSSPAGLLGTPPVQARATQALSGTSSAIPKGKTMVVDHTPRAAMETSGNASCGGSQKRTGRSQSTDALLTLMNSSTSKPAAPVQQQTPSPSAAASSAAHVSDMMNVMILCDGCDGSYHMVCVGKCIVACVITAQYSYMRDAKIYVCQCSAGLDEVPQNDWYCQPCRFTLS